MNLSKFICVLNRPPAFQLLLSPRKEEIRRKLTIEVVCDKSAHSIRVFLREKLEMEA